MTIRGREVTGPGRGRSPADRCSGERTTRCQELIMRKSLHLLVGLVLLAAMTSAVVVAKEGAGKKADKTVKMIDNEFKPKDVKIKVGQSIMWHNEGDNTHTATSDKGTPKDLAFDTDDVSSGKDSKVVTFKKAGTVKYHCNHHRKMTGTITIK
jgi:plastocyanin